MWCALLLLPLVLAAPSLDPELVQLTKQFNDELSTYLTQDQLTKIFTHMATLIRSNMSVPEMAQDMYGATRDVLTKEQQQQCWASIKAAIDSNGGASQMQGIVMNTLFQFGAFMADAISKDRAEFAAMSKNGQSEAEVTTAVYKRLRQYWNVEFGQKVIRVVKCSMTEPEWAIASKDAALYMKVQNFDMKYENC